MAVLQDVPGVQVQVVVDGKALKEYDDSESNQTSKATSKYVEAVSGRNFEIHTTLEKHMETDHDVSIRVLVDGSRISGKHIARKKMSPSYLSKIRGDVSRISGVAKQSRLLFSDLETRQYNYCMTV
jgi:hypothetical protein